MFEETIANVESAFNFVAESFIDLDTLGVFAVALVIAYLLSQLVSWGVKYLARVVGHYGDTVRRPEAALRLRRTETFLSVSLAVAKFIIFAISLMVAWQITHPETAPAAIIGASTIFVLFAGATLVPTLRDVTNGSLMIIEQWYNVGDFVRLEPFADMSGVVEKMTLRSTKIRNLNGEVIWVHNQHIQGVRATPHGVRTLAIDVFVNDLAEGKNIIKTVSKTLPVAPTMLASALTVANTEKLSNNLWHIEAVGQTAPGREWLLETFATEAIKAEDEKSKKKVIQHGPIVRYADSSAEKRFKRAVRVKKEDGTYKTDKDE
jgi:moderate conductance mechanosensitive channel